MTVQHGKLVAGLLEEKVSVNLPLKIQDVTFRDGHQSLFATRVRTEDLLPLAEDMDSVGFYAMEVWGGATFDTMHRYLDEDPWERLRLFKKHIKKTPLSMLLRGQNLVGYRNYADDVVEAFVERACENGVDIFRVFDALNDLRNLRTAARIVKKCGKHFQGTICYSLTEKRMGGEVYTVAYYQEKASQLVDMGADSICIKDMAGLLAPYDAYVLITALKEKVRVPLHLHSHFTSGMADMTLLKAIEAGVDVVDTCLAPWALRTSHPAVEPLLVALSGTNRDPGLDLELLARCGQYLEKISEKYRSFLDDRLPVIDINVLLHQTPGGMLSNLVNQLREMGASDKLQEVFRELPRVRRELGQVPLVTPTSQIIGTQAVNNVLFDTPEERYKMVTAQVKDLCYGLYGKTPAPIDPQVRRKVLAGYPRGETPIEVRPAEILEPELEKAKAELQGLDRSLEDLLIYALYPTTGKRFLRVKYGLEKPTKDSQSRSEEKPKSAPVASGPARVFEVTVNGENFRVEVREVGGRLKMSQPVPLAAQKATDISTKTVASEPSFSVYQTSSAKPTERVGANGTSVTAPMPGLVVSWHKKEGETVKAGETILTLEAMKMANAITAPVSGTILKTNYREGDSVKKGDVLAVIG